MIHFSWYSSTGGCWRPVISFVMRYMAFTSQADSRIFLQKNEDLAAPNFFSVDALQTRVNVSVH